MKKNNLFSSVAIHNIHNIEDINMKISNAL